MDQRYGCVYAGEEMTHRRPFKVGDMCWITVSELFSGKRRVRRRKIVAIGKNGKFYFDGVVGAYHRKKLHRTRPTPEKR